MNIIDVLQPSEYLMQSSELSTIVPARIVTPDTIRFSGQRVISPHIGTSQSKSVHTRPIKNTQTIKKTKEFNPVIVEDDKIKLSSDKLEIGKYYPIEYYDEKYLIHTPKKGIIDIYEIMD